MKNQRRKNTFFTILPIKIIKYFLQSVFLQLTVNFYCLDVVLPYQALHLLTVCIRECTKQHLSFLSRTQRPPNRPDQPTTIPFGHPHEPKTTRSNDPRDSNEKAKHWPAKRNLEPARAGSNENRHSSPHRLIVSSLHRPSSQKERSRNSRALNC